MELLFILAAVFLVAKWLISAVVMGFMGNDADADPVDRSTTIINHYHSTTNNHLHVTEEEYNKLKK